MTDRLPTELQIQSAALDQTQSALLVTVVQTAQTLGCFETLLDGWQLKMKQVAYSQLNKVQTLVASIAVGARSISQIQTKLVPDAAAAHLFGMARFPDQAQINAFLQAMGPEQVAHLEQAHAQLLAQHSRAADQTAWLRRPGGQRFLPVDLDQTYLVTRSAQAEGTARGYFGRKRGQVGYKKSLAFLGGEVREVLWQRLAPGNLHGQEAVAPVLAALGNLLQAQGLAPGQVLLRGDAQYGSGASLRPYQAAGVHYVVRGYARSTAQVLARPVPEDAWQFHRMDANGSQVWYADLGEVHLHCQDEDGDQDPVTTRVVLVRRVRERTRRKRGKGAPGTVTETVVAYEYYSTDLSTAVASAATILDLYDDRVTEESFFRAEQDAFGVQHLRTKHRDGQAAFLWLLASTVNLLRWTQQRVFGATPVAGMRLTQLVTEVLAIPGRVLRQGARLTVVLPALERLAAALVVAGTLTAAQLTLPFHWAPHSF
jgi:Transposase DDE domain group 1